MLGFAPRVERYRQRHLYRERPCIQPLEHNRIQMGTEYYLNFASNDYLGLSQEPQVIAALCQAAKTCGLGSTASRMICGHHPAHEALEQAFADWLGYDRAILFSNGYMANLGIFEALAHADFSFCLDKFCHTSLLQGGKASGRPMLRYQHNDMASLKQQLSHLNQNFPELSPLVVTEGLFSMDGDSAPLDQILAATQLNPRSQVLVDDAHAIGVLGQTGKGSLEHWNLNPEQVPILVLPLGKALGSYGAMVLTHHNYYELILQFSKTYTYTTNLPPAIAAASLKSLELVQTESWRRELLQKNIAYFQSYAAKLGLQLPQLSGPIQIIPTQDNIQTLALHEQLKTRGFFVQAIRAPSVPLNRPRLRLTLNCYHTIQEIEQLLNALYEIQSC